MVFQLPEAKFEADDLQKSVGIPFYVKIAMEITGMSRRSKQKYFSRFRSLRKRALEGMRSRPQNMADTG